MDNFRLLDHRGASHELYYLSDMKAVVLMAQDTGCNASVKSIAALNGLRDRYQSRGVEVLMLDSSLKDTRDTVAKSLEKNGSAIPVLLDPLQLIGESLDAHRAGEVLIVDPKNWTLVYRGSIEGSADALDATLDSRAIPKSKKSFRSCSVRMPERDRDRAHAKISYEKTIAPMLADHCVTCHRPSGIGPWQMS
ncbi:MAG TPA: redoxin domain-containing protein, partial [Steroidobacteraceae bacterium]|nr:redoxin domain-containing protein [Steroidobacteraceae bacterium]